MKLLCTNQSWLEIKDYYELVIHTGGYSQTESENLNLHTLSVGPSILNNKCLRLDQIPLSDWRKKINEYLKEN